MSPSNLMGEIFAEWFPFYIHSRYIKLQLYTATENIGGSNCIASIPLHNYIEKPAINEDVSILVCFNFCRSSTRMCSVYP